jgi:hypothetical protein
MDRMGQRQPFESMLFDVLQIRELLGEGHEDVHCRQEVA